MRAVDTSPLMQAIRAKAGLDPDRHERAQEVKATYLVEELGNGLHYVQHPQEDDRAYLVDLGERTCECPDYQCRMREEGSYCKHLIALAEITGAVLPGKPAPDYASWFVPVADPDPDDPYKD